jgi:hypothetical protein
MPANFMDKKLRASRVLPAMVIFLLSICLPMTLVFGAESSLSASIGGKNETLSESSEGQHFRDYSLIPLEPDEFDDREVKAYYDWRNDLFFREFDLKGSGNVDYMTARRTYKVWLDEFGTPVVITVGSPLFYWVDRNGNGEFETSKGEMWSDPHEDGITGEERLYDSSDLQSTPSEIPLWSAPKP